MNLTSIPITNLTPTTKRVDKLEEKISTMENTLNNIEIYDSNIGISKRVADLESINSIIFTILNNEILFENDEFWFRISSDANNIGITCLYYAPYCVNSSGYGMSTYINGNGISFVYDTTSIIAGSVAFSAPPKITAKTFNNLTYYYLVLPKIVSVIVPWDIKSASSGNMQGNSYRNTLLKLKSNIDKFFP